MLLPGLLQAVALRLWLRLRLPLRLPHGRTFSAGRSSCLRTRLLRVCFAPGATRLAASHCLNRTRRLFPVVPDSGCRLFWVTAGKEAGGRPGQNRCLRSSFSFFCRVCRVGWGGDFLTTPRARPPPPSPRTELTQPISPRPPGPKPLRAHRGRSNRLLTTTRCGERMRPLGRKTKYLR